MKSHIIYNGYPVRIPIILDVGWYNNVYIYTIFARFNIGKDCCFSHIIQFVVLSTDYNLISAYCQRQDGKGK